MSPEVMKESNCKAVSTWSNCDDWQENLTIRLPPGTESRHVYMVHAQQCHIMQSVCSFKKKNRRGRTGQRPASEEGKTEFKKEVMGANKAEDKKVWLRFRNKSKAQPIPSTT